MLTGELLRCQRRGDEIVPRYLSSKIRERLEPVAEGLLAALEASRDRRRAELESAWDEVPYRPADRLVVAGLRKLLLDRCEFAVAEGPDPTELREAVFSRAAAERRSLGPRDAFDRGAVLTQVAAERELSLELLAERLFADLRQNERLTAFRSFAVEELLARYDLALAQAVLLRATRVVVTVEQEAPAQLRGLFRAARFHGLLHRVVRGDGGAYRIELDGPLSLFSQSKRYGLKLAVWLPSVLRCGTWRLQADLLWGRDRQSRIFQLGPEQGLRTGRTTAPQPPAPRLAPVVEKLLQRFSALESSWQVAANDEIFALPDEAVCVPDLAFTHRETGEVVFLEVFGFWSRQAVWQRVETIARGFPTRIILAVGKHLRVSEEVLGDDLAGELYVYRTQMSAKAILERLERSPDAQPLNRSDGSR